MRFMSKMRLNSLAARVMLAYVACATLTTALLVLAVFSLTTSQRGVISGAEVADTTRDMADDLLFDSSGKPVGLDITDFER